MLTGAAVTPNDVVSRIAGVRWIVDAKLRVVENIEPLGTKLDVSLAQDLEVLQQGEVEIRAAGIVHRVPPAVSEGQPAGRDKSCRVVKQRPDCLRDILSKFNMSIGTADAIRIRPRSEIVGHARIVR